LHHQSLDLCRIDRIGGTNDIRSNQNEGANARRVSEGGIKRDTAPEGTAHQHCGLPICGCLQHRYEVCKGRKVLRLDASFAEPASVINDRLAGADSI
jgi:hypothetical protein